MLVAVAVLFAPGLTRAGAALASVPDHDIQMMESGHCKAAPSHADAGEESSGDDNAAGKTCCISISLAIPVAPPVPAKAVALHGPAAPFPLASQYRDRVAEIATPPPRLA